MEPARRLPGVNPRAGAEPVAYDASSELVGTGVRPRQAAAAHRPRCPRGRPRFPRRAPTPAACSCGCRRRSVARVADNAPLRVIVGEDQPIVREGIVRVLEDAGIEVVSVAADAVELLGKARAYRPDVVVTDIQMPPDNTDDGLRAAQEIRATLPGTGVVVLSQYLEDRYALDLVGDRADGVGYLLKERVADLGTFVEAVRRVARGGSWLDPLVVERMINRRRVAGPVGALTPREREVLELMAQGLSNTGIAEQFVVTVAAVERHVTSIFAKLGLHAETQAHRRVLAVLRYLER
jgi:DNA-binding NarL/FixJ family response regulator